MRSIFEVMAEAKIRDWQRRVASGDPSATSSGEGTKVESWETQVFKEIIDLHAAARDAEGEERARLLSKARDLRIQLMTALEKDRPLLARTLAEKLWREVDR